MDPLGIIGIVSVGIVYAGLNLFGIMMNISCNNWNAKK